MGVFGFVIVLIAACAALLAARWLMPHVIDQIAVYASMVLGSVAFLASVIGVIRK